MVLKRTSWRLCRCFIAAAVLYRLTAEEAEAAAWLLAADVLAVWQWWLKRRWLVLASQLVKIAAECIHAGNSSQIEGF